MLQKVIWGMRFFFILFSINVVIFTQTIKIMEIYLPEAPYRYIGYQLGYTVEGFKLSMRKNSVIKNFNKHSKTNDV